MSPSDLDFPRRALLPSRLAHAGDVDLVLVLDRGARGTKVLTTRVSLEPYEPNGPGCGTYWVASAVYRDDKLRQSRR